MSLADIKKAANERSPGALIEVYVSDLQELAESNPSHPASQAYLKAVKKRGDRTERPLYVDREDILAILENRAVIIERTVDEEGLPVIRKTLGKSLAEE